MSDQAAVRRMALALPGVIEAEDDFAFSVENRGKPKGFVWVWKERVQPKKPRIPNPAVLVRLAAVDDDELGELIRDAWRCMAPRTLVAEYPDT